MRISDWSSDVCSSDLVALDRRHDDLALGPLGVTGLFLGFDERDQVRDRLLHHACGFHHLRQKHLAGAEQIADHVHALHQRTFDHLDRRSEEHTSELQSLMRTPYAVFRLKKKKTNT